jgi:undecaprenyl-diphosphatase
MKSNPLDALAVFGAQYLIVILLAFAFALSFTSGVSPVRLLEAALAAWGVAFALQQLFRRKRPFVDGSPALIQMWLETPSFPSVHSSIAFAVAGAFLWASVPAAWLLLVLAAVLAWSRVRVRVHYASDVMAGAVIGLAVSYGIHLL